MLTTLLPPRRHARVAGFDIVSEGPRVRSAIGAALQEAALDRCSPAPSTCGCRRHCTASTRSNAKSAWRTAGAGRLTKAADRKVGVLGRMKRRLDLAWPRHEPRISSSTSRHRLDIQSRTASGGGRAAGRRGGVTVFLTPVPGGADVLADRVGIIDHGHIVAEGPGRAEGEIGRPTVEAVPCDPVSASTPRGLAASASPPMAARKAPRPALRRRFGTAEVVRALDGEGSRSRRCSCTRPRSTTSSWQDGRSLEGAEEVVDEAEDARAEPGGGGGVTTNSAPGRAARPPLDRADAAPARQIVPR